MPYELLPHTADLRAALSAPDLLQLYAAGVDLVREILVADSVVARRERRDIPPLGDDEAEAFFRFLRELVYLFDSEGFLAAAVVDAGRAVEGELFDSSRHAGAHQIKAVTRHGYSLESGPDGYRAHVVFGP